MYLQPINNHTEWTIWQWAEAIVGCIYYQTCSINSTHRRTLVETRMVWCGNSTTEIKLFVSQILEHGQCRRATSSLGRRSLLNAFPCTAARIPEHKISQLYPRQTDTCQCLTCTFSASIVILYQSTPTTAPHLHGAC